MNQRQRELAHDLAATQFKLVKAEVEIERLRALVEAYREPRAKGWREALDAYRGRIKLLFPGPETAETMQKRCLDYAQRLGDQGPPDD